MPSADSLTGFGMPGQMAELIGANYSLLNTSGATVQTGAAVVLSKNTELNVAGVTANSAVLPVGAGINQAYFFVNPDSTSASVFVPSGHTLFSSLNGAVVVAQNKAVIMWQYRPKFWAYILTA